MDHYKAGLSDCPAFLFIAVTSHMDITYLLVCIPMLLEPKNLGISFRKTVTHFGGVYVLYLFFKRIKRNALLSKKIVFVQLNSHYTISEMILAFSPHLVKSSSWIKKT